MCPSTPREALTWTSQDQTLGMEPPPWVVSAVPLHMQPCLGPGTRKESLDRIQGSLTCPSMYVPVSSFAQASALCLPFSQCCSRLSTGENSHFIALVPLYSALWCEGKSLCQSWKLKSSSPLLSHTQLADMYACIFSSKENIPRSLALLTFLSGSYGCPLAILIILFSELIFILIPFKMSLSQNVTLQVWFNQSQRNLNTTLPPGLWPVLI